MPVRRNRVDIDDAKTLVPGDQVKSRVSGIEGTFSHVGPNPGGRVSLVWLHTDFAASLWDAHVEDVILLPGPPPVREGCMVLGRAECDYPRGAAVRNSGEWVTAEVVLQGQWLVKDTTRCKLGSYSHHLHAPLRNVQVPKKEEPLLKETTATKTPIGADFLPGDRIQDRRLEYTGTVLRVEGAGPLAGVWYRKDKPSYHEPVNGIWVCASNVTLLSRPTDGEAACPFAVGERVRRNYDQREVTVTEVARDPHDPNDWRVDYSFDDGGTEWDHARDLVPLTGGATSPLPTARPKALAQPSAVAPSEVKYLATRATHHQAELLLALQRATLACRGCGHVFQPGDAKLSVQQSDNGRVKTALCDRGCWQKRLRG